MTDTHLAIALGIKADEASHPVLFGSATGWINRLAHAHATGNLDRELRRLKRYRATWTRSATSRSTRPPPPCSSS